VIQFGEFTSVALALAVGVDGKAVDNELRSESPILVALLQA